MTRVMVERRVAARLSRRRGERPAVGDLNGLAGTVLDRCGGRLRRTGLSLGVCSLIILLAACGAKSVAVPAPGAPHYPDFIYPEPPAGTAPLAAEQHRLGWQWLQAGDLRAAERSFANALKYAPSLYPSEAGLGYVGLAKKDYKAAISHFDRAVVADAAYTPALVGRGEAWLALGDRDEALASLVAAVAADPGLTALQSRIDVLRFRGLQDHVAVARKMAEAGQLPDARAAYERAIRASPQSPFLYRELSAVERREGLLEAALTHAQKAAALEPTEARNLVQIAEIHEAQGDFVRAADAYGSAVAIEPSAEIDVRIDDLRAKAAFAAMPPEYQGIEAALTVTRAQLAALFGVRLEALLKRAPRQNATVMTDTRGNWAAPWILAVSRAGIMEPNPNHTFQPNAQVRRGDLALAVSRAVTLLATGDPTRAATLRNARRRFPDLAPGNLNYGAASVAVESGVMTAAEDGSFQLARLVTGAEAVAVVKKLEDLSGRTTR